MRYLGAYGSGHRVVLSVLWIITVFTVHEQADTRWSFSGGSDMNNKSSIKGKDEQADDSVSLADRVDELDKRVKELNYVVYKLLYEMGGKEILEKGGNHSQK